MWKNIMTMRQWLHPNKYKTGIWSLYYNKQQLFLIPFVSDFGLYQLVSSILSKEKKLSKQNKIILWSVILNCTKNG